MRRLLIAVLLLASMPRVAVATTIVAVPERELIGRADTIVVAHIVRTWTEINERGVVMTLANAQVYRALRGAEAGDVITLRVPGGTLHGTVAVTPGSPVLKPGQLVFGFLQNQGEVRLPLGLSYGLLRVRTAADGSYRVFRDADGLNMLSRDGKPVHASEVQLRDVPLDELIARVERTLIDLGVPPPSEVRP